MERRKGGRLKGTVTLGRLIDRLGQFDSLTNQPTDRHWSPPPSNHRIIQPSSFPHRTSTPPPFIPKALAALHRSICCCWSKRHVLFFELLHLRA
uniref:Uncharacterized protein n=1 Tax=Globodera rostochiensis TaxID=31243 RepID=A0A914I032_GLORO